MRRIATVPQQNKENNPLVIRTCKFVRKSFQVEKFHNVSEIQHQICNKIKYFINCETSPIPGAFPRRDLAQQSAFLPRYFCRRSESPRCVNFLNFSDSTCASVNNERVTNREPQPQKTPGTFTCLKTNTVTVFTCTCKARNFTTLPVI